MLSTDRPEFEAQLAVLYGGWPEKILTTERKEAYWRGLQSMPMSGFVRCVDHALGEHGPERLPSANQIWVTYREIRGNNAPSAARKPDAPTGPMKPWEVRYSNICLLQLLVNHNTVVSENTLDQLVQTKNKIAADFELIASEETITADEIKRALHKAWKPILQAANAAPAPAQEQVA